MAMANSMHEINLLPNKGEGVLTDFLNWALTIGRLLIILTETVALGTFIYRFSLDMRIVDLHDQIKAESFIIRNFKSGEDTYRALQNRLALAKKYDSSNDIVVNTLKDIIELGKGNITFRSVLVSSDVIKIEAQAPTANSLALFVGALKKYPNVKSVSVDKVENKTSNAEVNIALTANLQTAKKTNGQKQINNQKLE